MLLFLCRGSLELGLERPGLAGSGSVFGLWATALLGNGGIRVLDVTAAAGWDECTAHRRFLVAYVRARERATERWHIDFPTGWC